MEKSHVEVYPTHAPRQPPQPDYLTIYGTVGVLCAAVGAYFAYRAFKRYRVKVRLHRLERCFNLASFDRKQ